MLKDAVYRRKFLLTLSLYYSYAVLAWLVLQFGTALPAMQTLVGVGLEAASWLFTTRSLGYVAGCLISGVLFDRLDKIVLLGNRVEILLLASFGMSACSAATPFVTSYPILLGLRVLTGVFCGGIDTVIFSLRSLGVNSLVPSTWGAEGGPYMQALYFSYTVGGIISPFATEPFMKELPRKEVVRSENQTINDASEYNKYNEEIYVNLTINTTSTTMVDEDQLIDASFIHIAFIITGVLGALSCIPYAVMVVFGGFDIKASQTRTSISDGQSYEVEHLERDNAEDCIDPDLKEEAKNVSFRGNTRQNTSDGDSSELECLEIEEAEDGISPDLQANKEIVKRDMTGSRLYAVLFCIGMLNLLISAAEDSLCSFLLTFCVDFLEWGTRPAATVSALYWVTGAIGGLCGIVIVRVSSTTTLLYVNQIAWLLTYIVALAGAHFRIDALIWICVPGSGLFAIQIIPLSISWIEENVCNVNGKVAAFIMLMTGIGVAANPSLFGFLMQEYSYMYMWYILVTQSVFCLAFYVCGHILTKNR
ncbi:MFS4B-like protein [Mya arenaria]|uniref:MFS4B-like protein n=1 Tax=Mya arenaria TaxID=6604 RepID=A0ABY7EVI2_MYAAR|nr:MFS4B-like protein [Mya arenaria]